MIFKWSNYFYENILQYACRFGNHDIVKYIISLNKFDIKEKTILLLSFIQFKKSIFNGILIILLWKYIASCMQIRKSWSRKIYYFIEYDRYNRSQYLNYRFYSISKIIYNNIAIRNIPMTFKIILFVIIYYIMHAYQEILIL